jgi:hypothetical protein
VSTDPGAAQLFERGRRKDNDGNFLEWTNPQIIDEQIKPRPIIDLKFPFYLELEKTIIKAYSSYIETTKPA